jgi:hypothetical protein
MPFASGKHKGSVPTLKIDASEFGVPPKDQAEPAKEGQFKFPTVEGPLV